MRKQIFLAFILITTSLFAKKAPLAHFVDTAGPGEVQSPWLTGPLLSPSGIIIPPGHYYIEPYIYATAETGSYNHDWKKVKKETFWNNVFQPSVQFGLLPWVDFQINPSLVYNYTKGAGHTGIGDMPIGFDFEIYKSHGKTTDWITAFKISLKEIIPLGKYQKLDPKKLLTDSTGLGSWQTGLSLIWGNLFYLGKGHFLTLRSAFEYLLPAPVHVKNLNAYGGAKGTRGTVYPPQNFVVDVAFELTLTQNWTFAMDILGLWEGKTRFKGKTEAPNTAPASVQFSLAPAIEYNWSANIGIIFGPWFTIGGRNATQFTSGVFAFSYYH
jgi:hypothetical protein